MKARPWLREGSPLIEVAPVQSRPRQQFSQVCRTKGIYPPILLKIVAIVSTAEKDALETEIFTLSRGFSLLFCVAARKNGVFSSQYMGSLKGLTFPTESARRGQS